MLSLIDAGFSIYFFLLRCSSSCRKGFQQNWRTYQRNLYEKTFPNGTAAFSINKALRIDNGSFLKCKIPFIVKLHWWKEETRLLNKISCYLNLLSTLTPFSWKQIMLKFREFSIILLYFFILYFFCHQGGLKYHEQEVVAYFSDDPTAVMISSIPSRYVDTNHF